MATQQLRWRHIDSMQSITLRTDVIEEAAKYRTAFAEGRVLLNERQQLQLSSLERTAIRPKLKMILSPDEHDKYYRYLRQTLDLMRYSSERFLRHISH